MSETSQKSFPVLGHNEYLHPLPIAAMGLMAVNDHVLKRLGILPGWLTGKLSDFMGLFFFPLLLTVLYRAVQVGWDRLHRARTCRLLTRAQLLVAIGSTVVVFVGLQLSERVVAAYVQITGWLLFFWPGARIRVTPDPTDLLALPIVTLTYLHGLRIIKRWQRHGRPAQAQEVRKT